MVGTTRVVKTDNDLVYHRNGICVPGSLPFLNLEARALSRSPHNQGSRDSLVVVDFSVEINSEQNRLSPPPLTVNDASEGIFLFVIK